MNITNAYVRAYRAEVRDANEDTIIDRFLIERARSYEEWRFWWDVYTGIARWPA